MLVNVCLVELCERDDEPSQDAVPSKKCALQCYQQIILIIVFVASCTLRDSLCLNIAFPGSEVNQGPSSLLEQQARVQEVTPLIKTTIINTGHSTKTMSSKSQTWVMRIKNKLFFFFTFLHKSVLKTRSTKIYVFCLCVAFFTLQKINYSSRYHIYQYKTVSRGFWGEKSSQVLLFLWLFRFILWRVSRALSPLTERVVDEVKRPVVARMGGLVPLRQPLHEVDFTLVLACPWALPWTPPTRESHVPALITDVLQRRVVVLQNDFGEDTVTA